jgi:signal peptide peptidase SppA
MLAELEQLGVAHIGEYFGAWAIYEPPFRALCERVEVLDLKAHVQQQMAAGGGKGALRGAAGDYTIEDGVAIIELNGPLMKMTSSFSGGSSTVIARQQLRAALRDDKVSSILMWIDSPGGTVSGTVDLADDVAEAAKLKPVYAFIEDTGASAAYWIASQASKVFANPTAVIGSIGAFMVVRDVSRAAENAGIRTHVISTGPYKGAGVPGAEVTDTQLADWQRLMDEVTGQFTAAIAKGRGMAEVSVKALADGRVHIGPGAHRLGLIDGVQTFDQTLQQLRLAGQKSPSKKRNSPMASDETTTVTAPVTPVAPSVASFADIEAACPGCNADFIVSQLKSHATASSASIAWMAQQRTEIEALKKQNADAKAEADAKLNRPGVPALKDGKPGTSVATCDGADPVSAWNAAVAAGKEANPGMPPDAVVRLVNRNNPGLRESMLEAVKTK